MAKLISVSLPDDLFDWVKDKAKAEARTPANLLLYLAHRERQWDGPVEERPSLKPPPFAFYPPGARATLKAEDFVGCKAILENPGTTNLDHEPAPYPFEKHKPAPYFSEE